MRIILFFLLLTFSLPYAGVAQLRLPSWISSGMVLQQNDTTTLSGWGGPGSWVKVTASWDNRIDSSKVSNLARWSLKLKAPAAGGPHQIVIINGGERLVLEEVMSGEVWICSGQSNMEWSYRQGLKDIRDELPKAFNKNIRLFHVPKTGSDVPQENVPGRWLVCDSISLKDFSAVGYFFGKRIHEAMNVPVGLIDASWGGTPAETWVPEPVITADPVLSTAARKLGSFDWWPSLPGKTYNGMIAALHGHSIAGAIWYQGESNVGTAGTYRLLMTALVDSWRERWKKQFPFYYVQIAPYDYGEQSESALLREAQSDFQSHPRTGMVVIPDLVDNIKDIHPVNKHDVGLRLANLALGDHYKFLKSDYRSPSYSHFVREKNRMVISFSDAASGLVIRGKELDGAFISGTDGVWHKALGKAEKGQLILWSPKVKEPMAVQYGFGNIVIGNVFSATGLPLAPFRTDRR